MNGPCLGCSIAAKPRLRRGEWISQGTRLRNAARMLQSLPTAYLTRKLPYKKPRDSAKATDWTLLQGVNVISRLEALSFLVPRNARSEQCERT